MSPRSNLSIMNSLIISKNSGGLEEFLAYCDTKDQVLKSYIDSYGMNELINISKEFRSKALQQKIEIVCEY